MSGPATYVVFLSRDDGRDEYFITRQFVYAVSPGAAVKDMIDRYEGHGDAMFTVTVRPA